MSKIYVSYTSRDDGFAQELMSGLKAVGHQTTVEGTRLSPGINWRSELTDGLKSADVFVMLISQSTMHSQYPMMELGTARAYAESSGRLLILPIILGDLPLPNIVQDIQVIFARDLSPEELILAIDQAISAFEGRRAAQEFEKREFQEAVQTNLADFVVEAIKTQQQYEQAHRRSAKTWYVVGYVTLFVGLATTAILAYNLTTGQSTSPDYARTASLALLNLVAIALLAALARYAYSLGKSFMSESLKSSDRIHAIQFGKFFLHAFGTKASITEIKEAFQHWNIDRTSTFSSLDSNQIDPQVVTMVAQLISAITGRRESKA